MKTLRTAIKNEQQMRCENPTEGMLIGETGTKNRGCNYFGLSNGHEWSSSWFISWTCEEVVDVVNVDVGGR